MTRHKHADLMIQHANDTSLVIEYCEQESKQWITTRQPSFANHLEYRIKPREFPKTSMTSSRLAGLYTEGRVQWPDDSTKSFTNFANAVIKQHILDTEAAK